MTSLHNKAAAIFAVALMAGATPVYALFGPDSIKPLMAAGKDALVCGIQADYTLSDGVLRVEVAAAREQSGATVAFLRAYSPSSVSPPMRDLWLKTPTLFTLGRFQPARENGNGILEARGVIDAVTAANLASEIAAGRIEISVIFDGPLPASRFPVGLPQPLPIELAGHLDACAGPLGRAP